MRSSIGPCGLDSQRFLASLISIRQYRMMDDQQKHQNPEAHELKRMRTLAA